MAESTFQNRLLEEREELNTKIQKLEIFIQSDNFKKIPQIQASLLNAQILSMKTYKEILDERIKWLISENLAS